LGGEIVESAVVHNRRSNAVTAENDDLLDFRIIDRLRSKKRSAGESQSGDPERVDFHVVVVPDAGFPLCFLSISMAALSGLEAGRARG
jgi:hypothetical protein